MYFIIDIIYALGVVKGGYHSEWKWQWKRKVSSIYLCISNMLEILKK